MALSRRKTPIVGMSTAATDKPFKQAEHRRERRVVKTVIKSGDEPPAPKAFGNPLVGEKDGKQWVGDRAPDLMRK